MQCKSQFGHVALLSAGRRLTLPIMTKRQDLATKGKITMRIRARKMIYLPVGGALAAGLLTSAFVIPQSHLAASQDCYGACQSDVSLSLSRPTVSENQERLEQFSVRVSGGAGATGQPTGSVQVKTRDEVLCRIHLHHGRGSCSLYTRELSPGSYEIVADYSGDANFNPAMSNPERLHVRNGSGVLLSLARPTVSVGRERAERFSVDVGGDSRRPTGSVYVETRGTFLCRINLSHGRGSCSLYSRELAPGSYEITAHYTGDAHFSPSTSDREHLTVRRH